MKRINPASSLISLQQEMVKALWEFVAASETLYQYLLDRNVVEIGRQLEEREKLIHDIDYIDARILQASSGTSQAGRGGISKADEDPVVHNLKTLLREAANLDAQCLAQLELLGDEFKEELATKREGWKAAHPYLQQAGSAPRFMDIQQ